MQGTLPQPEQKREPQTQQTDLPSLEEVLNHRRSAPDQPDGFKVALVIEGGSMRGVVAAGMITGLQALGLSQVFDIVVGTSAGAIAASYLLADQASLGPRIYYEDLTDRRWLDRLRPVIGKPLLDFDYLFDTVIGGTKKLDTEAVLEAGTRLLITATRRSDWTSVVIEPKSSNDLIPALKASSRIPVVGGSAVKLDGEDYLDGSITVSIPFNVALEQNPTHTLVLLTHPAGESIKEGTGFARFAVLRVIDMLNPGLGKAHSLRYKRYLEELRRIRESESAQTMIIRPSKDEPAVGLLEQDADRLYAGARAGTRAVFGALGSVPTDEELAQLLHRPARRADGLDDRNHT
jgi:predicted patatin/cPLA2 family phospholipase